MKRSGLLAIEALDLSSVRRDLVDPGQRGFSPIQADEALAGYREYLRKCLIEPEHNDNPTLDVDAAWHAHILRTKQYREDCEAIFGYYLDHFPDKPVPEHQLEGATCGKTLHATCGKVGLMAAATCGKSM